MHKNWHVCLQFLNACCLLDSCDHCWDAGERWALELVCQHSTWSVFKESGSLLRLCFILSHSNLCLHRGISKQLLWNDFEISPCASKTVPISLSWINNSHRIINWVSPLIFFCIYFLHLQCWLTVIELTDSKHIWVMAMHLLGNALTLCLEIFLCKALLSLFCKSLP